jgi:hypothetical protein
MDDEMLMNVIADGRPCSSSAYTFMAKLCAMCIHHGHAAYSAELLAKQGVVNIKLRTPQLRKLSCPLSCIHTHSLGTAD